MTTDQKYMCNGVFYPRKLGAKPRRCTATATVVNRREKIVFCDLCLARAIFEAEQAAARCQLRLRKLTHIRLHRKDGT